MSHHYNHDLEYTPTPASQCANPSVHCPIVVHHSTRGNHRPSNSNHKIPKTSHSRGWHQTPTPRTPGATRTPSGQVISSPLLKKTSAAVTADPGAPGAAPPRGTSWHHQPQGRRATRASALADYSSPFECRLWSHSH